MRYSRSGFTLIELLAVVFIIAVVMMTVVPALDGLLPSYRVRAGARHVAGNMLIAHAQSISEREEMVCAYDFEDRTFWIIRPKPVDPEDREEEEEPDPDDAKAFFRPANDIEHGAPPPDPTQADPDAEANDDFADRDALEPEPLPDDVKIIVIVVGDEEKRTGTVYVPFSYDGSSGGHTVGLQIGGEDGEQAEEMWVKYDPITRTLEYSEQRPTSQPLPADDE